MCVYACACERECVVASMIMFVRMCVCVVTKYMCVCVHRRALL